ncbi:MAG: LapA family protein [Myxococcota bacterium]|nr:LapA family protein [Myxococcota bacterium]
MNKRRMITTLAVAVLLGTPLVLFYLQNSATQVDLILKLTPSMAWKVPGIMLPSLLVITFLLGMLACALPLSFLVSRSGRRVRGLQRQLTALQDELEFNRSERNKGRKGKSEPAPSGEFDDLI